MIPLALYIDSCYESIQSIIQINQSNLSINPINRILQQDIYLALIDSCQEQ
mgnify:CR=1 FL=1